MQTRRGLLGALLAGLGSLFCRRASAATASKAMSHASYGPLAMFVPQGQICLPNGASLLFKGLKLWSGKGHPSGARLLGTFELILGQKTASPDLDCVLQVRFPWGDLERLLVLDLVAVTSHGYVVRHEGFMAAQDVSFLAESLSEPAPFAELRKCHRDELDSKTRRQILLNPQIRELHR